MKENTPMNEQLGEGIQAAFGAMGQSIVESLGLADNAFYASSCRLSLQTHYNLLVCHWRNPWTMQKVALHNLPPPLILFAFVLPALIV